MALHDVPAFEVASQIATKYASHDPYTLTMVDPKDIYAIANDYAYDLSDQDWAGHTSLGIKAAGKLAGFPVCVEARGIIYNADAIEKITGEEFDRLFHREPSEQITPDPSTV